MGPLNHSSGLDPSFGSTLPTPWLDEADLLSLLSEEEREAYLQAQQPAATPEPSPTPTPTLTPTPAPSQEPQSIDSDAKIEARATVLIGLIALMAVLIILFLRSKKGGKGSDARVIKTDETEGETTVYWSAFQTEVQDPRP